MSSVVAWNICKGERVNKVIMVLPELQNGAVGSGIALAIFMII